MISVPYEDFTEAFLMKITEYNFIKLIELDRIKIVDGYMKRAVAQFSKVCRVSIDNNDDALREYTLDIEESDIDELVEIISEGMLVQWFKQYMYKQENLENLLNTVDFSSYSPAELLYRVTNAYNMCKKDFINAMREYSFNHGDLTDLHL